MLKLRSLSVLAVAAVLSLAGFARAADKLATGITQPSQQLKLAFAAPGPVRSIDVKEGDYVKVGQVLAQLDVRGEEAYLQATRLEAESQLKVEYQKQELEMKKIKLKRTKDMRTDGVASATELEEAEMAVVLAATQVALAEQELKLKSLEAQRQAVKVDWMRMVSPIDGIVEKIEIGPGESVDPSKPSILLLKIDPLWVKFDIDFSQAEQLKVGETVEIRYPENDKWQTAKVIFLAQVDPKTSWRMVRLELPNPTGQSSGREVQIKLPERVAQAGGLNQ